MTFAARNLHLGYFDEVKYDPPNQSSYILGTILVPAEPLKRLDDRMTELARDFFGVADLSKDVEFHAHWIVQGKGPFKGVDLGKRLQLFCNLVNLIGDDPEVLLIEVRIDVEMLVVPAERDRHSERALMFLVEQVNRLMLQRNGIAVLVSDKDEEAVKGNVRRISDFKQHGTKLSFGHKVPYVVDTIHHTDSHHSRLLQLADLYVYTLSLLASDPTLLRGPRKAIVEHVAGLECFFPNASKIWPTGNSWWRNGSRIRI